MFDKSWFVNKGFIISPRTDRSSDPDIVYIDLPDDQVGENTITGFVSDKSVNNGKAKFMFALPVPRTDEEAQSMYGVPLDTIVRTGILGFARSADDKAKPVLFDGSEPTPERHAEMQAKFLAWRPGVREKAAVQKEPKGKLKAALKTNEGFRATLRQLVREGSISLEAVNATLMAHEMEPMTQEEAQAD